jgi:predicted nucleic acid-binding protein
LILLDTSVLSVAFRRRHRRAPGPSDEARTDLERMIELDWPLAVPGIVLQELLSGVRELAEVTRLRAAMEGFSVVTATIADHLAGAELANTCRAKGFAASTIDCLIAAQAIGGGYTLFTLDQDFLRIASCCTLALWSRSETAR